jgi:hypothetical protein
MDAPRGWELPQPVSPDHRFGIGQAFAVAVEEARPALAPGVVVAHDRNERSNGALRAHGIALLAFPGVELGRGRGRPRCISCRSTATRRRRADRRRAPESRARVPGGRWHR